MRGRQLTVRGQLYEVDQEPLAREGGCPPRGWYCLIIDPKVGRLIDGELVPEEHFRTKREAVAALLAFLETARCAECGTRGVLQANGRCDFCQPVKARRPMIRE